LPSVFSSAQAAAVTRDDFGHLPDRIQNARSGLAVHYHDVTDTRIGVERGVERGSIDGHILGGFLDQVLAPVVIANLRDTLTVGAVDQNQQLAVGRHEVTDHGFDHEGAAALQRNADVRTLTVDDIDQALENARVGVDESGVARAVIVQHRLLDAQRSGQRARSQ
jgi:hypothetical protein